MSELADSLEQGMALMHHDFARKLPEKLHEAERLWKALDEQGWDEPILSAFHRSVHDLAGSAATFGFPAIGDAARTLETVLAPLSSSCAVPPNADSCRAISKQLTALLAEARTALTPPPDEAAFVTASVPTLPSDRRVFVLGDASVLSEELLRQLEYSGFGMSCFRQFEDVAQEVRANPPAAVILFDLPSDGASDSAVIRSWQAGRSTPLPVIFISSHTDLDARLAAVRAGGAAFFVRPLDLLALMDKLQVLTSGQAADPYRILIVDDDPGIASHHALILQKAGMRVAIATTVREVAGRLSELRPDLILMDVYMPECTGPELAAVIRQQDNYVGTPIMFLSTETEVERQYAALRAGGDDFLVKSIGARQLVAAVTIRARRMRETGFFAVHDSLTGLLNHSHLVQQLSIEIMRAQRRGHPLAVAMIDIDHFKSVNDTYGHVIGDRVLKSLAQGLRKRLRKTDLVGRYGGEEFAAVLVEIEVQGAKKIIDEIRADFARVKQRAGGTEFAVTFSAGIAALSPGDGVATLIDKADKGLYGAKRRGRDRVELARRQTPHAPIKRAASPE